MVAVRCGYNLFITGLQVLFAHQLYLLTHPISSNHSSQKQLSSLFCLHTEHIFSLYLMRLFFCFSSYFNSDYDYVISPMSVAYFTLSWLTPLLRIGGSSAVSVNGFVFEVDFKVCLWRLSFFQPSLFFSSSISQRRFFQVLCIRLFASQPIRFLFCYAFRSDFNLAFSRASSLFYFNSLSIQALSCCQVKPLFSCWREAEYSFFVDAGVVGLGVQSEYEIMLLACDSDSCQGEVQVQGWTESEGRCCCLAHSQYIGCRSELNGHPGFDVRQITLLFSDVHWQS